MEDYVPFDKDDAEIEEEKGIGRDGESMKRSGKGKEIVMNAEGDTEGMIKSARSPARRSSVSMSMSSRSIGVVDQMAISISVKSIGNNNSNMMVRRGSVLGLGARSIVFDQKDIGAEDLDGDGSDEGTISTGRS